MNELRAYDVIMTPSSDGSWVLKSEAKRAIAEKDKELRHHKYKRCLDKAAMCEARYDEEDARVNGHYSSWEYISEEMKYWERWQKRWLELAEKFKLNQSTAQ